MTDKEMLRQKIEWYKKKQDEVKESVIIEREEIGTDKIGLERELVQIEGQRYNLNDQRKYTK